MKKLLTTTTTAEERIRYHLTAANDANEAAMLYHATGRTQDEKQAYKDRWWHLRAVKWIQSEWETR
jgi:hypothetical protein